MDELYIRVKGGGEICVPASGSMTTYVLIEQEDWFEKEITFVRRLLRPGMRAIDVGANYGTYTLAMAQAVGPQGRIWAYEPTSATARYLRETIRRNSLAQVDMQQAALSDRTGTGRLHLDTQVELNRLVADSEGEEVALTTLDTEAGLRAWGPIDFIKIDAEGGELAIIQGGNTFLAKQSPLVMFERHAADGDNEGVRAAFLARGYTLFKLIGPDTHLVPIGPDEPFDAFDLNLFACKPDRADVLSAAGLLAKSSVPSEAPAGLGLALWQRQEFASSFGRADNVSDPRYRRALDAYAVWRAVDQTVADRSGALLAAAEILQNLAANSRKLAVLSTAARVTNEAGGRMFAIDCLNRMLGFMRNGRPALHEPFWPPAPRYDAISPGADRDNWFLAATVEAYELGRAFSSQFAGPDTLGILDWLAGTRYATPAMERRRQLIAIRAGRQRQRQPTALLNKASDGHLNPQLWEGRSETPEPATGPGG
jgi:FkbM family methyltransferase